MHNKNIEWLSAHIFYNGEVYSYEADRVILEIVDKFVSLCKRNKFIRQYFFIRYSENGPHIRLRIQGESEILNDIIKPALNEFVYQIMPKELVPLNRKENPMFISYEPEYLRYGGKEAIRIAEKYFFYSSELTISLLKEVNKGETSERLGKGLLAMIIILNVMFSNKEKVIDVVERYQTGYLSTLFGNSEIHQNYLTSFERGFDKQSELLVNFINDFWEGLIGGVVLPSNLKLFKSRLILIKKELLELNETGKLIPSDSESDFLTKSMRIVPSYIHMMNNRLGISIPEETYLAYLIKRALKVNVLEKIS